MKKRTRHPARRQQQAACPRVDCIYGIHAAAAALANPRRTTLALHATRNGAERLRAALDSLQIAPVEVSPTALSKRLGDEAVHQGVMVETSPLPDLELETAIERAIEGGPLIVLDQVTDPHNVGAILRSAAAFGAAAVIMTRRNSPPLDGALAKSASGALEHVPVVHVANLARSLEDMGRARVQRIGLEGSAEQPLESADVQHPCALVLGAEHKGLRRLTEEHCDLLCRLTTPGPMKSLNVSNAAAVALYAVLTRTG